MDETVNKVLKTCESVITEELQGEWKSKKYIGDLIRVKPQNVVFDMHPEVTNIFHEHISKLSACYTSIHLKHFSKLENEKIKKNRLRKKLSKFVHFSNQ